MNGDREVKVDLYSVIGELYTKILFLRIENEALKKELEGSKIVTEREHNPAAS